MAVGTAQNTLCIRLILTVILPEANLANFILPSPMQGLGFAARASERLGRLFWLIYPLYTIAHVPTVGLSIIPGAIKFYWKQYQPASFIERLLPVR
jgi:hypothetical protein